MISTSEARDILGKDLIGLEDLLVVAKEMGFSRNMLTKCKVPAIPFSTSDLRKAKGKYILMLVFNRLADGRLITINGLRKRFGVDPGKKEPCFYNQDWYLREGFAKAGIKKTQWALIRKDLISSSRAQSPQKWADKITLPCAVITAYAFFVYWFYSAGRCLWKQDYIWCSDLDHNGDRVYVGRYKDPSGLNKNGFEVHRHLSIKNNYGVADIFTYSKEG